MALSTSRRPMFWLLAALASICVQNTHDVRADTLYGLSWDGRLGQLDTVTSAWTQIRSVPALANYSQYGAQYGGFAVDQGTFVVSWTANVPSPYPMSVAGDFIAFGTTNDDYCLLGHVPSSSGLSCPNPSVRPTSGTLNGLAFSGSTEYMMQIDLPTPRCTIPANSILVPNPSFAGCYEANGVGAAAFRDQNTFYAFRSCSTGSIPDGTYHTTYYFTRWTYSNSTWNEDRDIQLTNFVPGAGGMAVDPSNQNTIYVTNALRTISRARASISLATMART